MDEINNEQRSYNIGMACVLVYQNYGSAFTNFALYNLLKDYGKSVLLINQPMSSEIKPTEPQNFAKWKYPSSECAKYYDTPEHMKDINGLCEKILVGSDQLFNYEIYKRIDGFIKLDWVDEKTEKVSYATSFGINEVLGSDKEREDFKRCIKRFRHISVRESDAVALVKKNFNISATCVLDPVFLCDKSHYIGLIRGSERESSAGRVFCYILDPEREKQRIIKCVCDELEKPYFAVSDMWRSEKNIKGLWNLETAVGLSNEEWLSGIYNSAFVIADSFHGLCFSLLFNKPFIAVYNELRGSDRLVSLLKILKMEDRLVYRGVEEKKLKGLSKKKINWERVNDILGREADFSRHWFENNVIY